MSCEFRAYIVPLERYQEKNETLYFWQENGEREWSLTTSAGNKYSGNDLIVEKWVGDYDQNHNPIFEGDIVQQVSESWWEDEVWTRHELDFKGAPVKVRWEQEEFGFRPFLNGCGLCREMGWFLPEDCVVIGNIHDGVDYRKMWEEAQKGGEYGCAS